MKASRHIYAIAGLVTVLSALSLSSPAIKAAGATTGAGTAPVTVTNTVASPVPTMSVGGSVSVTTLPPVTLSGTPNVNVANTPTVQIASGQNVGIAGTPSVNIANTPDVSISTSPDSPVHVHPVAESDGNHVAKMVMIGITNGNALGQDSIYTVPFGKVLVVKDISIRAVVGDSSVIDQAIISGTSCGNLFEVNVPMQQITVSQATNTTTCNGSLSGCSYVFQEGTIYGQFTRNSLVGGATITVSINGYLEDAS